MNTVREGWRLIESINAELHAGTRHFSGTGRELTTPAAIIRELLDTGVVDLKLPKGRPQPDYLRQIQP
jgi:hypothetical protein